MTDRYIKIVLTVIALELGWLGLKEHATPVAAQAQATPVVIRGIDMNYLGNGRDSLPITLVNSRAAVIVETERPLKVEADRPLPVEARSPLRVDATGAVRIFSNEPIKVENVGYTPARRPGE